MTYQPAVIVGLGGLGLRVLRRLQAVADQGLDAQWQEALQSGTLRLLGIDVDPEANAPGPRSSGDASAGYRTRTGASAPLRHALILDRAVVLEALAALTEARRLGAEATEAAFPDASTWFPEGMPPFSPLLTPGQASPRRGLGTRVVGRLALSLHARRVAAVLKKALVACVEHGPPPRALVVCALAGATGSGMVGDIGRLVAGLGARAPEGFFLAAVDETEQNKRDVRAGAVYAALLECRSLPFGAVHLLTASDTCDRHATCGQIAAALRAALASPYASHLTVPKVGSFSSLRAAAFEEGKSVQGIEDVVCSALEARLKGKDPEEDLITLADLDTALQDRLQTPLIERLGDCGQELDQLKSLFVMEIEGLAARPGLGGDIFTKLNEWFGTDIWTSAAPVLIPRSLVQRITRMIERRIHAGFVGFYNDLDAVLAGPRCLHPGAVQTLMRFTDFEDRTEDHRRLPFCRISLKASQIQTLRDVRTACITQPDEPLALSLRQALVSVLQVLPAHLVMPSRLNADMHHHAIAYLREKAPLFQEELRNRLRSDRVGRTVAQQRSVRRVLLLQSVGALSSGSTGKVHRATGFALLNPAQHPGVSERRWYAELALCLATAAGLSTDKPATQRLRDALRQLVADIASASGAPDPFGRFLARLSDFTAQPLGAWECEPPAFTDAADRHTCRRLVTQTVAGLSRAARFLHIYCDQVAFLQTADQWHGALGVSPFGPGLQENADCRARCCLGFAAYFHRGKPLVVKHMQEALLQAAEAALPAEVVLVPMDGWGVTRVLLETGFGLGEVRHLDQFAAAYHRLDLEARAFLHTAPMTEPVSSSIPRPRHICFCGNSDCAYDLRDVARDTLRCPGCRGPIWNRCGNVGCLAEDLVLRLENEHVTHLDAPCDTSQCPACGNGLRTWWWFCPVPDHRLRISAATDSCPACVSELHAGLRDATAVGFRDAGDSLSCAGCEGRASRPRVLTPDLAPFYRRGVAPAQRALFDRLRADYNQGRKRIDHLPAHHCADTAHRHMLFPTCPIDQEVPERVHHLYMESTTDRFQCPQHAALRFVQCARCAYPVRTSGPRSRKCPRCLEQVVVCLYCHEVTGQAQVPTEAGRCGYCGNLPDPRPGVLVGPALEGLSDPAWCVNIFQCPTAQYPWHTATDYNQALCGVCRTPNLLPYEDALTAARACPLCSLILSPFPGTLFFEPVHPEDPPPVPADGWCRVCGVDQRRAHALRMGQGEGQELGGVAFAALVDQLVRIRSRAGRHAGAQSAGDGFAPNPDLPLQVLEIFDAPTRAVLAPFFRPAPGGAHA